MLLDARATPELKQHKETTLITIRTTQSAEMLVFDKQI
ncbi:hypothetical protein PPHE_b0594 [Pseudoalteromonas phenolica O-BC30]|nr:hypothetical protein [Pseudoalteromonas phenolica O-BC30]